MIQNSHNCAGKKQSNIHHFTKTPFIIAETSYNHEGDMKYLYNMIDEISELRINAVKFHLLLNIDSYMVKTHPLYSQLQKWLFTIEQWNEIYRYSKNKGLEIIALCDDIDSVKYIINKKM